MRLQLAVPLISRDGTLAKDALLRNGYIDPDGLVLSRPGSSDYGLVDAGQPQGVIEFDDICYAVIDDVLSRVDVSGVSASVLTTDAFSPKAADLPVSLAVSGKADSPQVLIKSADQAWVYEP